MMKNVKSSVSTTRRKSNGNKLHTWAQNRHDVFVFCSHFFIFFSVGGRFLPTTRITRVFHHALISEFYLFFLSLAWWDCF